VLHWLESTEHLVNMSRIFRRPMFRKGGPINDGIMTGIVDRENHAVSDEMGVGGQTFRDTVQNRLDLIQSVSGGTGLDDPLTQFLLQYGPSLATQRPTGSTIGTLVAAAKEPTAQLLKDVQAQKKLKTGVALEVLDQLSDEDIAPFIKKAKAISKESGRDYKEVLDGLIETELYRKGKSPQEQKQEDLEVDIASLMSVKDAYQNPLINKYAAEEVATKIRDVRQGKIPGVAYEDIDIDQPYLLKKAVITNKDEETGTLTLDENSIRKYTQGAVIYDYRTNKFYKVQGQQLIPVGE
jgi:hypothetical protein